MKRIITFGTFDLFHIGHLNILKRAKEQGDHLIVGVSSDELNYSKKHIYPVYPLEHRMEIVKSIRYVDNVFVEESLEKKRGYILAHKADTLVMGDDWRGKFDEFKDICEVAYLDRTPIISTSEVKIVCQKNDYRERTIWNAYEGNT